MKNKIFLYNEGVFYELNHAYFLVKNNIIKRNTWTGQEIVIGKAKNKKEALKFLKNYKLINS